MTSIIICGPDIDDDGKYVCTCCKRKFDDIEQLAVSICWDCMYGNPDCANCREELEGNND